jgi:DNA anti-recombination protein RmuC
MEDLENIDDHVKAAAKHVKGMSWGARIAAVMGLSSILGTLYAGFLMYQKIEEIAGLDLGAYQQQMEVMDAKVTEAVDYARDIKNGLRDDIIRIEQQADRTEDLVRSSTREMRDAMDAVQKDTREMIDSADERFETRREQLRTSQDQDMKELEERLEALVQKALDNPLADK